MSININLTTNIFGCQQGIHNPAIDNYNRKLFFLVIILHRTLFGSRSAVRVSPLLEIEYIRIREAADLPILYNIVCTKMSNELHRIIIVLINF